MWHKLLNLYRFCSAETALRFDIWNKHTTSSVGTSTHTPRQGSPKNQELRHYNARSTTKAVVLLARSSQEEAARLGIHGAKPWNKRISFKSTCAVSWKRPSTSQRKPSTHTTYTPLAPLPNLTQPTRKPGKNDGSLALPVPLPKRPPRTRVFPRQPTGSPQQRKVPRQARSH